MPKNSNSLRLTGFNAHHESEVARRAIMEEREAEKLKQLRYKDTMDKIKFHRIRGMSEASLIRTYGNDAVRMEHEARTGKHSPIDGDQLMGMGEEVISSPSIKKPSADVYAFIAPLSARQAGKAFARRRVMA